MKTLRLLQILFLASLFVACSEDDGGGDTIDPDGSINQDLIVGSWRVTKEVDVYDGITETYPAECPTEVVLDITDTMFTTKNDEDCDGNFDYEDTFSYSIQAYGGFENVLFINNNPGAIVVSLSNTTLILREDYITDPDSNEEEYYDVYFTKI